MHVVAEIARALNATLTLETALGRVLELTATALDADAVSIFVKESSEREDELRISFARRGGGVETGAASAAPGLAGLVLSTGDRVNVADVSSEPRFAGTLDSRFGTRTRALLAVPMRRRDHVEGVVEAIREQPRGFNDDDAEFLQGVADELAVAVENARLVERMRWDLEARELVLRAARTVGSSLDLDEVLDHLIESLSEFLPCDAVGIYLLDEETGALRQLKHRGYPPGTEQLLRDRPGRGITGWVGRQRQGLIVDNVHEDPRYIEARPSTRSEIAAPIVHADKVMGVITLESDQPDAYNERQLTLLETLGSQVASAVTNAHFLRSEVERAGFEREVQVSREIQQALFPRATLSDGLICAAGINVPSSAIGGDYYDYYRECPHHLGVAIADVSGHGLSAALLTVAVRSGVHLSVGTCPDPAALAWQLNHLLYESTPANQFVSAVLGTVEQRSGLFRYCNAGHVPPLHVGAHGTRRLEGGGLILGAFPDSAYDDYQIQLEDGDLLVFYTDGLTEFESPEREQFGLGRLEEVVVDNRDRPVTELIEAVRKAVRAHRRGAPRHDDVTLMVLRWGGS